MAKQIAHDLTVEFDGFGLQFGCRQDELLMWMFNDMGQTGGCPVDRRQITALRDFLDRLLAEYPPLMEDTDG